MDAKSVPKMSASNPEWSEMKANHKIQVTAKAWLTETFSLVGRREFCLKNREMAFRTQKCIDSHKKKDLRN